MLDRTTCVQQYKDLPITQHERSVSPRDLVALLAEWPFIPTAEVQAVADLLPELPDLVHEVRIETVPVGLRLVMNMNDGRQWRHLVKCA